MHPQRTQFRVELRLVVVLLVAGTILCAPLESPASTPFQPGEQLEFKVYFEFVLGGTAVMAVKPAEMVDGRSCILLESTARSTPTVDMMYKVRDRIRSWLDVPARCTRRYAKELREGSHRDEKLVEYFPEQRRANLTSDPTQPKKTIEVDSGMVDVLAAFYTMRQETLEVGKSLFIDVHDITKQYKLEVKVLGRERVEVPAGEFDCFVVEPLLKSSGIFRKEGSLQIWVTDDEYKMPVLMKSRLYFGRVWAKLTKFKRGIG